MEERRKGCVLLPKTSVMVQCACRGCCFVEWLEIGALVMRWSISGWPFPLGHEFFLCKGWLLEDGDCLRGCSEFMRGICLLVVRKQGAWVTIMSGQSSAPVEENSQK